MDEMQREAIAGFARAALDGEAGTVFVRAGRTTYEVTIDDMQRASVEVEGPS